MTSFIITYHNEGLPFISECINQLRASIDVSEYEIIVVDDGSAIPLAGIPNVKILRNKSNIGMGQSFDYGIKEAVGDDIIFLACDMRFIANNWVSKLVKEINDYPESLICTACVGLNQEAPENMDFLKRRLRLRCYGATILMFHDKKSNPRKEESFRGIIEAKWNPLDKTSVDKSYEIPCILGACYGVKKSWYSYIDGFWGHHLYGTLEPYISLKSWLMGGSCRVAPHIETGHIFKREGTHGTPQDALMFNKMLVATLLLEDGQRYIDFLGTNSIIKRAKMKFERKKPAITAKRVEYKDKIVRTMDEIAAKFNLDLRK